MRYVISLSTIPPRFGNLGPCLMALLRQKARPEAVELYIPRSYRRFPAWGGALPEVPDGVTIVRVDEDLGPATKILPAARAYRGQDVDLLFGDDDKVFGPDWAAVALGLRTKLPGVALCGQGFNLRRAYGYDTPDALQPRMMRSSEVFWTFEHQARRFWRVIRSSVGLPVAPAPKRVTWQGGFAMQALPKHNVARSGYADILEGCGGVLVRPDFFSDEDWNVPAALWAVDDIWLSGMMARRGIPLWVDSSLFDVVPDLVTERNEPLKHAVINGLDRHAANRACIDYLRQTYGIWGGKAVQST